MDLVGLALLLIFVGFLLVFFDILITAFRAIRRSGGESEEGREEKERTEAGGVIFIGPIPIIFGTSRRIEKWMMIVALIITLILVVLFLLPLLY